MLTNNEAIKLCDPLVKWAGEPLRPQDAPVLLSRALMLADSAPRGPVYLSVPLDDWDKPVDEATVRHFMDRGCAASPVVAQGPLDELIDALRTASSPAMVLGPGVDTELGFASAVSLAERAHLPVYIAPSPPRSPFRTRHPCYQGQLPSAAGALAQALSGYDVIVTFGAPVFRYHAPSDADYLAAATRLFGVTDDPDEAARAPIGRLVVGDPSEALARSPRPSAPPTVPNRRRATCPPPTCPVPVTRPRRSSTPSTAERPTTR
ncbi:MULTISPECIES: hypothetical protein [unclassified Streptomyces]|uniref:hypothetical protein n=1 Tax=unclassified Streptomyces TaxID=2593676 RepID=UPI0040435BC6